ncbi:hypothetical protein TRFO_35071 [Tritrichomonas foetus]|uniref:Uncharacterized protein n=1 Tax=Tritrichomonas foetus TaxID=1144522 RepID=A0A1J4JMN2_9EUKA|nr:hypothetical protein TRFO_35071 [Tritrichomonas foetus]|eukprot:OHS98500.1 hypothetical protein TRFO_35071 [Tritrichomonas foetus]
MNHSFLSVPFHTLMSNGPRTEEEIQFWKKVYSKTNSSNNLNNDLFDIASNSIEKEFHQNDDSYHHNLVTTKNGCSKYFNHLKTSFILDQNSSAEMKNNGTKKIKRDYEQNKIENRKKQLKNFDSFFELQSPPVQWMVKEFGKPLSQIQFQHIYSELKEKLPKDLVPGREEYRDRKIRAYWMNTVWENVIARDILQSTISTEMFSDKI